MAFSGTQNTRLGLGAFARSLYGSFAGKAEAPDVIEAITRLGLGAFTRPLYGDFTGKAEAEAEALGRYRGMLANVGRGMRR